METNNYVLLLTIVTKRVSCKRYLTKRDHPRNDLWKLRKEFLIWRHFPYLRESLSRTVRFHCNIMIEYCGGYMLEASEQCPIILDS